MLSADKEELRTFVDGVSAKPGVYQFYDVEGRVLYVGKARSLIKRLKSYFSKNVSPKTLALVNNTARITVTVTSNESEALLLECNLIKKEKPRYNVLLRDDKSYPYIYFTVEEEYPGIYYHRSKNKPKTGCFGPYPNARAAKETLFHLQKIFKLRTCSNSYFKHRQRPCLLYQIHRCSAPCVGLIDQESYHASVSHAKDFLQGKGQHVLETLTKKMNTAAKNLQFESAARLRDQCRLLQKIQSQRQVATTQEGDMDILGFAESQDKSAIYVLEVRGGLLLGGQVQHLKCDPSLSTDEMMEGFISQYYLQDQRTIPSEIIVQELPNNVEWLIEGLSETRGRSVEIRNNVKGRRQQWLRLATENAVETLTHKEKIEERKGCELQGLASWLHLPEEPQSIVCFDVSHFHGAQTVGACVLFNRAGACKAGYRAFNITEVTPGDDISAMAQTINRYIETCLRSPELSMPDLILVDGGRNQLQAAQKVLDQRPDLQILAVGIAKGPQRKPGLEKYWCDGQLLAEPPPMVRRLLERIRDEAHRFAITRQRRKTEKEVRYSELETIPGVGRKRRQALLAHLGGWREVQQADVERLASVPGISYALAERIYWAFHTS